MAKSEYYDYWRGVTFEEVLDSGEVPGHGDVVIVMHSEVEYILPSLEVMKEKWDGPIGAYAHSGYWSRPNWNFDAVISPENYLWEAEGWVGAGARLIGGCCGIGPEHIRLLSENLMKVPSQN